MGFRVGGEAASASEIAACAARSVPAWVAIVLTGALAALLTFGAAGARAQAGALGSGPAVGVDPANHAQVVFWRGTSGDIQESHYYTRWRGPVDVTRRFHLGPTSAAPAIAVANDDQQYLFWRGSGGHIHEGHHTTRWTTYSFRSWGTTSSAPAVAVDPSTNDQYVFYLQSGVIGSRLGEAAVIVAAAWGWL